MQHLQAGKEEPGCPVVGLSASLGLSFPMCKAGSLAGKTMERKGASLGLMSVEALGKGSIDE